MFLIAFIVGAAGCRYRQEQVIFQNKEVTLAGTLTLPSCNGPHPAVVFIRGSGPDSRDNYRFYADVFARHGIAKRIYDKRGVGASTGDLA
jgi:predicted acyl esterase